MTTIAQRRVAGATALMILLYLLQVALFAPPAQAAVSFVSEDPGPGSVCPDNKNDDTEAFVDEDWGTAQGLGNGGVDVTLNEGYVVDICVKQGQGHQIWRVTYAEAGGEPVTQNVSWDPDQSSYEAGPGLSHWGWNLVSMPPPPAGSIVVTKSPSVDSVEAPGGPVTFAVTVENTSAVAVDIDTLDDDIYGDVTVTTGAITATDCVVPQSLAAADATVGSGPDFYSCSFTAPVTGDAGTSHTNTVTASGTDENDNPVSDSDDATVRVVAPPAPGEADVQVTFGCDEQDVYVVNFTTSNATIVWTVNGSEETVVDGQSFTAGTEVSWEATADAEHDFVADADVSGSFTAQDCSDTPPTTPPPPPPSTTGTTTLQSTSVNFDAFCDDDLNFVAAFSLPNASGNLDINGDGVFGPGEINLASGTYVLTGETYAWQANADAGFTLTGITSGSGETENCAEVLGTTITTAPAEVSADTLPFTGFESGDTVKLGLLALLAGVLMLFAVRGPKEEEPATVGMGGWSSL